MTIKGVNLGGWFVLESWMTPDLFKGLDTRDETGFVTLHSNPAKALKNHWETFITKADFQYLAANGIHHVRLPIPWWLCDDAPYINPLPFIKQAMKLAHETGIKVLLDLHTAPGCQNGFDNGGIEGVMTWHLDQANINLTIERLAFIAKTFKDEPALSGIQVLNEPHRSIDDAIIIDFYLKAYQAIRRHTDITVVFHDAFRADLPIWKPFFTQNQLHNVMFDIHPYHCFDEGLIKGSFQDHINVVLKKRLPLIRELASIVPLVIGEWSLGIRYDTMQKEVPFDEALHDRLLMALQLYAYQHAHGHYFWSYKIARDSHVRWDFRRLVEAGIMPADTQKHFEVQKNGVNN